MKKNIFANVFETIAACMKPIIPLLVASGLLKILVLLLGYTGIFGRYPQTEQLLMAISDGVFYFLPLLAAYTSACHFKMEPLLAMAASAVFLLPDFINLLEQEEAVRFLFIPVYKATYAYSVLPIILLVYVMSKIAACLGKIKREWFQTFLMPVLTITVTGIIGILIIGPLCTVVGSGLSTLILMLQNSSPVLAWAVFAGLCPVMVLSGTHWIFVAMVIESLGNSGIEPGYMVSFFIHAFVLGGICLGMVLGEKEKGERSSAFSLMLVTLFAGVSEPVLYGVCIPKKYPLAVAMLGCFCGGLYQGIFTPTCTIYAFPAIPSILMFYQKEAPMNLVHAIIAAVTGFVAALLLMVIGKRIFERKAKS